MIEPTPICQITPSAPAEFPWEISVAMLFVACWEWYLLSRTPQTADNRRYVVIHASVTWTFCALVEVLAVLAYCLELGK